MNETNRFFLVVEGNKDGYPNYQSAKVHFETKDPALVRYDNLFICSPLFSLNSSGQKLPTVTDDTIITFIMVKNIHPTFSEIIEDFKVSNELWYSLGLANLVIIESRKSQLARKIIKRLEEQANIIAYEEWQIENDLISLNSKPETKFYYGSATEHLEIEIADQLPLHLKFTFSEYIISVDKFLTGAKRFTPQYFEKYKKTVSAANDLILDLSYLHGNKEFTPTQSTLDFFRCVSIDELNVVIAKSHDSNKLEAIINDKYSRLVQFNSSMSYIYSQAYAGSIPIFDHIGIIRRHSLLGVGTAISALFELISQIEEALFLLPFEDVDESIYSSDVITQDSFFDLFSDPSGFKSNEWEKALIRVQTLSPTGLPDDFFYRLAFFSGRLGFREYDLTATAAIQVLVEAYSLQWNVINYTHEIIHNHVRTILNSLLKGPLSVWGEDYHKWLDSKLGILKAIHKKRNSVQNLSFQDYFVVVLLNFCVNARIFGSLSRESNYDFIRKIRVPQGEDYRIPDTSLLKDLIVSSYKDLNEIFVHVIDFTYIYSRDTRTYVKSIWTSWVTVSSVIHDFKQYILRTLIVISLGIKGESKYRFDESKKHLIGFLEEIKGEHISEAIFNRIVAILNSNEDDLLFRYYNCVIVGDLVNIFFTGNLESLLDNDDENCLPKGTVDEEGITRVYDLDRNTFKGVPIKSKVRFALDQLIQSINSKSSESDPVKERTSAWLLLSLSSYNNHD